MDPKEAIKIAETAKEISSEKRQEILMSALIILAVENKLSVKEIGENWKESQSNAKKNGIDIPNFSREFLQKTMRKLLP